MSCVDVGLVVDLTGDVGIYLFFTLRDEVAQSFPLLMQIIGRVPLTMHITFFVCS